MLATVTSPIDPSSIRLPHVWRRPPRNVSGALEAGKHVYTEKPLAATYAEGEPILVLAKERGLSVCCAPSWSAQHERRAASG
jgi:hypothetical protein